MSVTHDPNAALFIKIAKGDLNALREVISSTREAVDSERGTGSYEPKADRQEPSGESSSKG